MPQKPSIRCSEASLYESRRLRFGSSIRAVMLSWKRRSENIRRIADALDIKTYKLFADNNESEDQND